MFVSFIQSVSGKLAFMKHLVIMLTVRRREAGRRLIFSLLFRTATWVTLLFVCNRLQKTGHHSGSQMLRNGAKCEEESQVGVSPMVVIFSLWWGHFPLWESCLLKGYGPNLHWFLGSGKSPSSQHRGSDFFKVYAGLKSLCFCLAFICLYGK